MVFVLDTLRDIVKLQKSQTRGEVMVKRSSEEEMEFRNDCQALLEAVNDTEGMNPEAAEENKHILLELICQALDIKMEECEE